MSAGVLLFVGVATLGIPWLLVRLLRPDRGAEAQSRRRDEGDAGGQRPATPSATNGIAAKPTATRRRLTAAGSQAVRIDVTDADHAHSKRKLDDS